MTNEVGQTLGQLRYLPCCSLTGLEPLSKEPAPTLLGEPGNVVSTSEAHVDEDLTLQQEIGINELAEAFQVRHVFAL